MNQMADEAFSIKKKNDRKTEITSVIKRKHGEILMREKLQEQKYHDFKAKVKSMNDT